MEPRMMQLQKVQRTLFGQQQIMNSEKCSRCFYQFNEKNRRFYCCNINRKYCILCKQNGCLDCKQLVIRKQIFQFKCSNCLLNVKDSSHLLYQPNCHSRFCRKCIACYCQRNFPNVPRNYLQLPCGHKIEEKKVDEFFIDHCYLCGVKFDEFSHYELLNSKKCCNLCFQDYQQEIQCLIMVCMSCDQAIKNFSEVGFIENNCILCKTCVSVSKNKESQFLSKKSILPSKQEEMLQHEQEMYVEKKYRPQVFYKKNRENLKMKKNNGKIQSSDSQNPQSLNERDIFAPLKSVLNKFPSDKENKIQNKKKHLSMETLVQKLKLNIAIEKEQVITCVICSVDIPKNTAFLLNTKKCQKKGYYCRCCYTPLERSGYLGFTTARREKESRQRIKSNQKASSVYSFSRNRNSKSPETTSLQKRAFSSIKKKIKSPDKQQKCEKCQKIFIRIKKTVQKQNICPYCLQKRLKK